MKKCFTITIVLSLAFCEILPAQKPMLKLNVDWENYLAKQDLIWDTMPQDYFAAAFVGNGLLGAILFKDDSLPNTLRFEIGRTDVYDHRTKLPSAYETSRLPIGQLLLTPIGQIKKIKNSQPLLIGCFYFACKYK